jgi:hypothetical protein
MAEGNSSLWIKIVCIINLLKLQSTVNCFKSPTNNVTSVCQNIGFLQNGFILVKLKDNMDQVLCKNCRHVIPLFDDHDLCLSCRIQEGSCGATKLSPCIICSSWKDSTWKKLDKSKKDALRKREKRSKSRDVVVARDSSSSSTPIHISDSELKSDQNENVSYSFKSKSEKSITENVGLSQYELRSVSKVIPSASAGKTTSTHREKVPTARMAQEPIPAALGAPASQSAASTQGARSIPDRQSGTPELPCFPAPSAGINEGPRPNPNRRLGKPGHPSPGILSIPADGAGIGSAGITGSSSIPATSAGIKSAGKTERPAIQQPGATHSAELDSAGIQSAGITYPGSSSKSAGITYPGSTSTSQSAGINPGSGSAIQSQSCTEDADISDPVSEVDFTHQQVGQNSQVHEQSLMETFVQNPDTRSRSSSSDTHSVSSDQSRSRSRSHKSHRKHKNKRSSSSRSQEREDDRFSLAMQNMQKALESNMSKMFANFSSRFRKQNEFEKIQTPPITARHSRDQVTEQESDPYVLELQDKGGYDSEGRSVQGDSRPISHTVSHTVSHPPPPPDPDKKNLDHTRPSSPTGSTHSSEFDSDNLYLRLKRQRENLLSEVAIAGGFTREDIMTAQFTGVSSDMVGSAANTPPNLNLPWSKPISDHVTVHEKIITGNVARTGTPLTHYSSKNNPWKIGELFKEGDLSKAVPFPKAYRPCPPSAACPSEAVKLETTPQAQPFERANAQGMQHSSKIDLSQGRISLTESILVAQENLILRLLGANNSLDTLLQFAATQQEHLSADTMAEVIRHSRFDVAASSSYAWRAAHNIRLLRRQAALNVLQESNTHPPLSNSDFQELYQAPLNSESLFGGKLAEIHHRSVQEMQVRPVLVTSPSPGERNYRTGYNPDSQFRRPYNQAPPKKRAQKRQTYTTQGPPAKKCSPAGVSHSSSFYSDPLPNKGSGKGKGKNQGGRNKGRGGNQGRGSHQ